MKDMGVIARDEKQLTLIYSSNTRVGKRAYAYLKGFDKNFLGIDIAKTKVSDTQWVEIADALNIKVADLVDKKALDLDTESTNKYDANDWLKIIQKNDKALYYPIAIKGKITRQIVSSTELLEFYEVDSAGLEQSPSNDTPPDIERTTKGENFIEKNK
ncbi:MULTISPECIES: arsenate reductase family protein [Aequorivita]|uniref:Arsenate reductase n=1 Tax=Aequorivita iocasae TaxID=2803865 RepID=A0ABX7DQ43_9FLAO|nr:MULTISPECIES: hypothetical protein [Aequorivita]QQX76198.1 hypothetical protein JK629_12780 [Aequorivita iocasae]UCA55657.1 hypothetical protein LDL78_12840 [Aequorivita sp. F7]